MTIRTHTFRGKRYAISFPRKLRGAFGQCDAPADPGKAIVVRRGQSPLDELDTTIHEALHACHWDMSEDAVAQTATDVARFLWRLGYRRVQPPPKGTA